MLLQTKCYNPLRIRHLTLPNGCYSARHILWVTRVSRKRSVPEIEHKTYRF